MTQLAFAGVPDPVRALGQYWTPPRLARKIAESFPFAGHVLEPTAGTGNLVKALVHHAPSVESVMAIEKDESRLERLSARMRPGTRPIVVPCRYDFLAWAGEMVGLATERFAWSASNVPDASKKGVHAIDFLECLNELCDENVALVRSNVIHGDGRHRRLWSRTHIRSWHPLVHRPAFDEDGGMQEWSVVHFGREPAPFVGIQHWTERWS